LTLTFADAGKGAMASSLGAIGGGLGWSGIPGLAVTLNTFKNASDPSNNFIGLATGFDPVAPENMVWAATATAKVPPLRGTVRHINVTVVSGTLTVSVDGTQVLSTPVTLPPSTLIGFTGATASLTDRHAVSNVVITAN
jgi:hypothetical protein